ncbi:HXXEE domain-containing protein [candidate division KSB1 bacterium]|nr:HXXEE domain-containing protein [candidate division KSB1 bacterium]
MQTLLIWGVPVVILVHNIEEAIWLPRWANQYAGRWHKPVGAAEFRFAVVVLSLLAFVLAGLTHISGFGSIWHYLLAAYALGQAINIFVPHLVVTLVTRHYAPGLITGLVLVLPAAWVFLNHGFSREYLDFATFGISSVIFIPIVLLSIPLLFRLGRKLYR